MDATSSRAGIEGHAEAPFGAVAEVFAESFALGDEVGAAVCVYHRGRKVVDLWGGVRDRRTRAPWRSDTLVPVFSTGKAIAAMAVGRAVSEGRVGFDDRIAGFWPAFAAKGKGGITVADVLTHRAGLVLFGRSVDRRDLADPATMAAITADLKPHWTPGTAWGYHMGTFGPLVGEILRRTDPGVRHLSAMFREEIAEPLGIDLHFGLPDGIPPERVATAYWPTPALVVSGLVHAPFALARQALNPFSLLATAVREIRDIEINARSWIRNEFASANAVASVPSIARLYALFAAGGGEIGLTGAVQATMVAPPEVPPEGDRDRVMGVRNLWRLGFVRPSPDFAYSPSPTAFGMPGLGGSFGFADPEHGLAYAYAPNRLGLLPFDDPRDQALRQALYASLGVPPSKPAPADRPTAS